MVVNIIPRRERLTSCHKHDFVLNTINHPPDKIKNVWFVKDGTNQTAMMNTNKSLLFSKQMIWEPNHTALE